ncbi:MAG: hypothetical protein ACYCTE_17000, partial [Acidimicrobiales bacterium]
MRLLAERGIRAEIVKRGDSAVMIAAGPMVAVGSLRLPVVVAGPGNYEQGISLAGLFGIDV